MRTVDVVGFCPACGHESLHVVDGKVVCARRIRCPRPDAAHVLLQDPEPGHLVEIKDDGFTVRHPLIERLDDAFMDCALHACLHALPGPPVPLGRYRVARDGDGALCWDPA